MSAMSSIGEKEALTQKRVVEFFHDTLGYRYLGNWKDREGNANVEEELLTDWLKRNGHSDKVIQRVLFEINRAKALGGSKNLYDANREFYGLLRYGVKVQPDVGQAHETVWLIDWENLENNDFAIAEEVTVTGEHTKRPDIVLYVNGIAVGVLELKRSIVSVTEGIRQNLDSQKKSSSDPSSVPYSSSWPGTRPRACATVSLKRRKNTGCAGRKTKPIRMQAIIPSFVNCGSCAARSGCWRLSTISWCSMPEPRKFVAITSTSV